MAKGEDHSTGFLQVRWKLVSVRLEITGVGLVVIDAGIIQGFCLQRLTGSCVLITKQ